MFSKFKSSIQWSFLIQLSFQIIGFVVSVILARILSPSDFGILGILTIFINLSKKVTDGGLAASLIRSKEIDDKDFSTVFYFNLGCSIFLYVLLFLFSPIIASFFEVPLVEDLLKVHGLSLIISAFTITQSVRLNKDLKFKTQFKILLPSLLLSGGIGIISAYLGYGVWSLVIKEISFAFFASIQLWLYSKWKPLWLFDKNVFKKHFSFGYKLVLTDLVSQFFKDSYKAIISKSFSPAQLGYFTRAKSMEELPNSIVFNTINRVLFPLLSTVQNDPVRLKTVYSQIIKTVTFLVTPFLMLLHLIAEPLFIFLLTEKWLPAVPFFRILLIAGMIAPLQPYLLNICKVLGRSDLVLKLSLIEYFFISIGILAIIPFGIEGLLWGMVAATLAKLLIAMISAGKLINYSVKEQVIDLREGFLVGFLVSMLIVFIQNVNLLNISDPFLFISSTSLLFYILVFTISFILKFESISLINKIILNSKK